MRPQALVAFAAAVVPVAFAQTVTPIDVSFQGGPANGGSDPGDLSADGRFATFVSVASNLVPGDSPAADVFVRDLELGVTTRITADSGVVFPTYPSQTVISADGRFVGYSSQPAPASTLLRAAFRHDRTNGQTQQLAPGLLAATLCDLSADGAFAVVIGNEASSGSVGAVYRLEVGTGTLLLCSRDANGNPATTGSATAPRARIDDAGARIVFTSAAANLVANDTNGVEDVFVFDVATTSVARVSVDDAGVEANDVSRFPTLSADGRFVSFESQATNLVANDVNGASDVFVRDLELGTTVLVSLSSSQQPLPTSSDMAVLSPDATHVAFADTTFVVQPPSATTVLRVRDLTTGITRTAEVGGQPPASRVAPTSSSADGLRVAAQLVRAGGSPSVVLVDFGPPCSASNYCTSLPNSTGASASITAQGELSLEANSLVIAALDLPRNALTVLLMSDARMDPGAPFGHGLLCLGGSLKRMGSHLATDGVVIAAQDVLDPRYALVEPGDERNFQLWYRDAAAPGGGFNTTDAIAVTFCW